MKVSKSVKINVNVRYMFNIQIIFAFACGTSLQRATYQVPEI